MTDAPACPGPVLAGAGWACTMPTAATPTPAAASPRQIVLASERAGNPDLFVMNADGTGTERLTDDLAEDLDPAWSWGPGAAS